MNIRDILNPSNEGSARRSHDRRAPVPASTQPAPQPSPLSPMARQLTSRPPEWVIVARGDFPRGEAHPDNRFHLPDPPSVQGEEQFGYHKQFQMPESGPYEVLDKLLLQSRAPQLFLDAEPALPNSPLHRDALRVYPGTSSEPVMRVWVDPRSAEEHRRAAWVRMQHVRTLPRVEGWQVVKQRRGGVLTRYLVMLEPSGVPERTSLRWEWMTEAEIRQHLPRQCEALIQSYRSYNPNLTRAEAQAHGRRTSSKRSRAQFSSTSGGRSYVDTEQDKAVKTEAERDGYDQMPSPKRQRAPVDGERVGVTSQALQAAGSLSAATLSHSSNVDSWKQSPSTEREYRSRTLTPIPQREADPESQLLSDLEESVTTRPSAAAGPQFTPINYLAPESTSTTTTFPPARPPNSSPKMPRPTRDDPHGRLRGRRQPRRFAANVDVAQSPRGRPVGRAPPPPRDDDLAGLELFPDDPPEFPVHVAPPNPAPDDPELNDLDLDLEREVPPGQSRIRPRRSFTKYIAPSIPSAPGPASAPAPAPLHPSPSLAPTTAGESPLSSLSSLPSPILPTQQAPSGPQALPVQSARPSPPDIDTQIEPHQMQSSSPPTPAEPPRGSVYPQVAADQLPVRRSARLGARGQTVLPEALMNPLAKERLMKAKEIGIPASKPVGSRMAPASVRGRGRPKRAGKKDEEEPVVAGPSGVGVGAGAGAGVAGEQAPALKRGRGRPKGSTGKKKSAQECISGGNVVPEEEEVARRRMVKGGKGKGKGK